MGFGIIWSATLTITAIRNEFQERMVFQRALSGEVSSRTRNMFCLCVTPIPASEQDSGSVAYALLPRSCGVPSHPRRVGPGLCIFSLEPAARGRFSDTHGRVIMMVRPHGRKGLSSARRITHPELPVKQASQKAKTKRVFGQRCKQPKMFRAGSVCILV